MSDGFKWNLTPTERRIAEAAYADSEGGAWRAVQKVMHLRGERGPWGDDDSMAMNDAMLAELRSEPPAPALACLAEQLTAAREEACAYAASVQLFWDVAEAANYDGPKNATDLASWFARCHARHAEDHKRYSDLAEAYDALKGSSP